MFPHIHSAVKILTTFEWFSLFLYIEFLPKRITLASFLSHSDGKMAYTHVTDIGALSFVEVPETG